MTLTPDEIVARLGGLDTLNLYPIENRMSIRALGALATDSVNRYPGAEGPEHYFGDPRELHDVYESCAEIAGEYFGVRHVFVNLLSGLHAMHSVLSALCAPGARVLVMDPTCGGHYATGPICDGNGYDRAVLPFDRETCLIDTEALARLAAVRPPDLVYLDLSTIVRLPRITDLRGALGPEPLLCLDASHLMGVLPDAPEGTGLDAGVTSCSGSTHKSLPGPQKGLVMTNDDSVAERLAGRLPFTVSSAHSNSVAALAITLAELMPVRREYAAQVRADARALARQLATRGFDVPGERFGHTETHQVWISPPPEIPGKRWGRELTEAGVRSTTVVLPATTRPGLRLGVQELARMGMREPEMERVADLLAQLLLWEVPAQVVRGRVRDLVRSFPDVAFTGDVDARAGLP